MPGRLRKPASSRGRREKRALLADGKGQRNRETKFDRGDSRAFLAPRARSKVKMKKRIASERAKKLGARAKGAPTLSRASTNGRGFRDRIDVPPADGRPDIVSFQKNCGRKSCGELKKKKAFSQIRGEWSKT